MSVEDWARREAVKVVPIFSSEADTAVLIAGRLASALLSDEAITAVFENIDGLDTEYRLDEDEMRDRARAALQAAVDAVTKGDTE